jgi:hypothetical protein
MQKKSSQEEADMRNETAEEGKEELSKGKSSLVTTVERSDTSHEIAGNQNATITLQTQDHRVQGRVY